MDEATDSLIGAQGAAANAPTDTSESRFLALFEQSPISTLIYDAAGHPLRVNAAFTRLWGLTIADLQPDYRIFADPQLAARGVLPLVERAFAGEAVWLPPFRYDALPLSPDGRARWTEAFLYPIVADNGRVREVVLTQFDVSERIEAEAALRASEGRYRSFMALASEGIWRTMVDEPIPCDLPIDEQIERFAQHAYIAECNEAMAQLQGYGSAAALRGTPLRDVLVRSAGNHEGLRAFIRSGYRLSDIEATVPGPAGDLRSLRHNLVGILLDGMFVGVWGTTRDVTPLQRAEALARGQVEALTRTIGHLADSPNLDALLGHVLYEIIQQVDALSGSVFIYDAASDMLTLHTSVRDGQVARGPQPGDPPAFFAPFPVDSIPLLARLQHTREVILSPNDDAQLRWIGSAIRARVQGQHEVAAYALRAGDQFVGVLGLTFRAKSPLTSADTQLIQTLGQQAALAIQLTRLAQDARQVAILEERTRLAREIHDTLAQGFTGIIVQLQAAEQMAVSNPAGQQALVASAITLAKQSLMEARRSVQALRAPALVDADLGGALLRMMQHMTAQAPIAASFAVAGTPVALAAEVEGQLLRIGQEAITNVLRHAQAAALQVELRFDSKQVQLRVVDDGVGFVASEVAGDHYGLVGMRERAHQLGATLSVQSVLGQGTAVAVSVPIAQPYTPRG
jgi:PAS domain S-box-containing protein